MNRDKEKERLWNEVMNQKRPWQKDASTTLKSDEEALDSLNSILRKNNEKLQKEIDSNTVDVDSLARDLEKDYGVKEEPVEKSFDSEKLFHEIEEEVNIPGQKEAVHALCTAFRRPYVTGYEKGQAKNVILVLGKKGTGKHEIIQDIIHELYKRQIVLSRDMDEIDLSRYTSSSQEQIFLQDLYESFQDEKAVVCFENYGSCFPGFLRMLSELVTEGKMLLNKRYVSSKGILVENQTGLVKNAVDHLTANNKYLIFISEGKLTDVQDAFGASFLTHVSDVVELKPLDDTAVKEIIVQEEQKLVKQCQEKLKIDLVYDDALNEWVLAHYEKDKGRKSVEALFSEFEKSISEVVLKEENIHELHLVMQSDEPCMEANGKTWKLINAKNHQTEMEEINAELDEIVGLKEVKDYIHSLQANVLVQQRRKEQGLKSGSVSMHMIFTGNPGTGKTTIARLLARYMKAAGVLDQGQLVEVTRGDLVAKYVGQTAPLTMSVINSALGGVLFIDEAYSLYRGKEDSFGLECIDTLVKAMEDHRDNLIVILAGYEKEMSVFLEANSGLKSRFPNIIHFPDYTGKELTKIAVIQAKSKGYVVADDALHDLEQYFDTVQKTKAAEAGNGRLARNVIEAAVLKQSERLVKEPDEDLSLLKKEDFDLK